MAQIHFWRTFLLMSTYSFLVISFAILCKPSAFASQTQPIKQLSFSLAPRLIKELRGSFQTKPVSYPCSATPAVLVKTTQQNQTQQTFFYTGQIINKTTGKTQHKSLCQGNYQIEVAQTKEHQTVTISAPAQYKNMRVRLLRDKAPYYGLGEQFDKSALAGEYPMIVQEGGIARGLQPLSFLFERVSSGSSGHRTSTYFPHPVLWSSFGHGIHLAGHHLAQFNVGKHIEIEVAANQISLNLFKAASPLKLLTQITKHTGRQPLLPDWIHKGAIVGIQGGSDKVEAIYEQFRKQDTPITGLWLQDWVGRRRTSIGSQLWWNWEINKRRYPRWQTLRKTLHHNHVNLLGYINPFLVDAPNTRHNYYQEAFKKGYFVKNESGQVYPVKNTDFSAGLLDLSHPEVGPWIKNIIQQEMIKGAGFKAWMADYAEALPLDAKLYSGDAETWHNRYPVEWARLNAEAIKEANCNDCSFFMRSGYNGSTRYTPLFWEGDQLVTWDKHDGLASAVNGLLSSGLSGIALNHSDAGGYTSVAQPVIGGYKRSPELLHRWLETNMFTAILRTHEGNQPELNAQIYSNPQSMAFFDRCARIYAALFDYRKTLFQEAHQKGWPVVRHLLLHYPADIKAHRIQDQFMLGSEFMVAPILEEGSASRQVYLPAGKWVHLWSHKVYGNVKANTTIQVKAPLGYPPVFYPAGSAVGEAFYQELKVKQLL